MVALVLVFGSPALATDAVSSTDVQSSSTLANPLAAWPLDVLSDTRDRPLFSPSRRPPPPVLAAVAQVIQPVPEAPPPNIVLLGIVTDAGGAQAVLRTSDAATPIRARLGDEIAGWKVSQIEPRRLVLSIDDRSVSFALFARPGVKATVNPGPAPFPPDSPLQNAQNVAQERLDRRSGRY
jgi:general secretion pathway protein N